MENALISYHTLLTNFMEIHLENLYFSCCFMVDIGNRGY